MRVAAPSAAWLLLGLVACGPERIPLSGAFPEDVRHVGAILVNGSGSLVGATPVLPFDGDGLEVETSATGIEEAWVFGWTDTQLANRLPDAPAGQAERLGFADADSPRLPVPSWSGRSRPAGAALSTLSPVPALTVGWLDRCPSLHEPDERLRVEIRCGSLACEQRYQQVGCDIDLQMSLCSFSNVGVRVASDGRLVPQTGLPCESATPTPPAVGSIVCGGCVIDLYPQPLAELPNLERVALSLADRDESVTAESRPYGGELDSLALLGDRVHAVAVDRCSSDPNGMMPKARLTVVDVPPALPFSPVGPTLEFPGICNHAQLAPLGSESVLVGTSTSGFRVMVLDANGAVLRQRDFEESTEDRRVMDVAASTEMDRLVFEGRFSTTSRYFVLRASDLELIAYDAPPEGKLSGGATFFPGQRILLNAESHLLILDALTGTLIDRFVAGTGEGVSNSFQEIRDLSANRFVGMAAGGRSGLHIVRGTIAEDVAFPYQRAMWLSDILVRPSAEWPSHEILAVGFGKGQDRVAVVARAAVGTGTFWPVDQPIGYGPVVDLSIDRYGYAWAVFPAEGNLVRFDLGRWK